MIYSEDPLLVDWPGHYGTLADGSIDKHCRLAGNHQDGWERVS